MAFKIGLVLASLLAAGTSFAQSTSFSGLRPETSVVLLSEDTRQAQMALQSGETFPLLLHVTVYDVSAAGESLSVVPLPPVMRVEPKGRQIVRFLLETPKQPLEVQSLKRVTFEGIPPRSNASDSTVQVNVKYDLPMIISPRGLKQHESPWELLKWRVDGRLLTVVNPSPFVVRLSREISLLPAGRRVDGLTKTFILPKEEVKLPLPDDVSADAITGVRVFPASLYGIALDGFDSKLAK